MTLKRTLIEWWNGHRWFRRCECCSRSGATRYHQNTQYVEPEANIVSLCPPCKRMNDQYWSDMWADYYSGRL